MIDYYATGKEYLLSNGKKIIIKRAGMGFLYRLLYYYMDIEENNKDLKKISNETNLEIFVKEYNRLIKRSKQLSGLFKVNIEPFINVKWNKIPDKDKLSVTRAIIDFNTYSTGKSSDSEVYKEDIFKQHNFMVLFLMDLGYTERQACYEVSNYKASVLYEAWEKKRVIELNDMRVATQASQEGFKEYVLELKGYHLMNPTEVIKGGYLNGR